MFPRYNVVMVLSDGISRAGNDAARFTNHCHRNSVRLEDGQDLQDENDMK